MSQPHAGRRRSRSPRRKPQELGKRELLAWAAKVAGSRCESLEDLRDGVVLALVFADTFPAVVSRTQVRTKVFDVHQNWKLIQGAMKALRLPAFLVDKPGIEAARFKPAYSALVSLYFLHSLTLRSNFTEEFAHPIDAKLARWLQSPASLECLERGCPPEDAASQLPSGASSSGRGGRSVSSAHSSGRSPPPDARAPSVLSSPLATQGSQDSRALPSTAPSMRSMRSATSLIPRITDGPAAAQERAASTSGGSSGPKAAPTPEPEPEPEVEPDSALTVAVPHPAGDADVLFNGDDELDRERRLLFEVQGLTKQVRYLEREAGLARRQHQHRLTAAVEAREREELVHAEVLRHANQAALTERQQAVAAERHGFLVALEKLRASLLEVPDGAEGAETQAGAVLEISRLRKLSHVQERQLDDMQRAYEEQATLFAATSRAVEKQRASLLELARALGGDTDGDAEGGEEPQAEPGEAGAPEAAAVRRVGASAAGRREAWRREDLSLQLREERLAHVSIATIGYPASHHVVV